MPDAIISAEITANVDNLRKNLKAAGQDVSNFSVNAQGDILAFDKSIQTLERQLKSFQSGLKTAVDPSRIATLNSAILITKSRLEATSKAINGAGFQSLAKGAGSANIAVLELSRGIQDAPFGSMGYINNLQQFQQLFANLTKESGSFKGAVQALGQSLLGPAGIGVAFSLITTGLQLYTMWQQKSNRETKEQISASKELADSILSIEGVQEKGRQNASKDLSRIQTLYKATQDLTIPEAERLRIAKEILKEYPAYLKGITAEGLLAGQAATQYERLTEAIMAKGYVQAAEENRQKLINQQLNLTIDKTREQVKLTKLNNQLKSPSLANSDLLGQEAQIAYLNLIEDEADKSRQKIIELNKSLADGRGEIKLLDSVVSGLVKDFGADVIIDPEKTKKGVENTLASLTKQLKEARQKFVEDVIFGSASVRANNEDLLSGFSENLKKSFEKEIGQFIKNAKDGKPLISLPALVGMTGLSFDTEFDIALKKAAKFNSDISGVINSGIVQGVEDIAGALGSALATGQNAFEAIGISILGTFGSVLTQLGKIAIATGLGIEAITTALKTLNPVVALAAGAGLLALGAFISSSVRSVGTGDSNATSGGRKKIPGFASGVENFGGGLAYVHQDEVLMNLPKGTDVVPKGKVPSMFGGGTKVNITGRLGISMRQLILEIDRERALQGRTG